MKPPRTLRHKVCKSKDRKKHRKSDRSSKNNEPDIVELEINLISNIGEEQHATSH